MSANAAGSQFLRATTNVPSTGSVCCWAINTVVGTGAAFGIDAASGSDYAALIYGATNWTLGNASVDLDMGVPSTAWTFLAVTFTINTTNGCLAYQRVASASRLTLAVTTNAPNITCNEVCIATGANGSFNLTGTVAFVKVWDVVLTLRELELESYCGTPMRRANLNRFIPLQTGAAPGADFGGRGQGMTVTGTLTDGAPAPVPMRLIRNPRPDRGLAVR